MIEIRHRHTGNVLRTIDGAILSDADLYGADLHGADLYGANLSRADLSGANLSRADLSGADLSGANLYRADLSRADLPGANLSGANLSDADLSGATLYRANLSRANLYRADLPGANLHDANLSGTVLDPDLVIPGLTASKLEAFGFHVDGNYVYGYRSRRSQHVADPITKHSTVYEPGRIYTAPFFSRDVTTACHPGLYLCPTIPTALAWSSDLVVVRAKLGDVIAVGPANSMKFRCPELEVLAYVSRRDHTFYVPNEMGSKA